MKRALCLIILIILTLAPAASFADGKEYRALEKTAVYEEPSAESAVIGYIEQNQIVVFSDTVTADSVTWCKVNLSGTDGYIEFSRLYEYREPAAYSLEYAKATAKKGGKKIVLYSDSGLTEQAVVIKDGVSLTVLERAENYSRILYQDKEYYISNDNLTKGLTYYQQMALIIGVICAASIFSVLLLSYLRKNRARGKS